MTFEEILQTYWGYDSFRSIQRDIIESIATGHDTLGLMPTGGGKSITFQVPAIASEGICIVITPLIALMKDQVEHLRHKGIKATAIYSGLSHQQMVTALDNCILGDYKLLYVSPERIGTDFFQNKLAHMRVSFICVDEAHCISQWGHDFRPSYLDIKQIRHLLPDVAVLALTATATPATIKDIEEQLEFTDGNVFRMSFERKNLIYLVQQSDVKEENLHHLLDTKTGSTIVYCHNRQRCRELAQLIESWGITATYYHAGLTNAEKDERQHRWQRDQCRVIVATNAFGMGIDKPDVRMVIHMGLPASIEAYFQEAGRAGRDGQTSEAILLYDYHDLSTLQRKVAETFPERDFISDVYDEVCCYLQIAIGYGMGLRREFNIMEYCRNFHRFSIPVESALMLLTRAGYIRYTDADEGTSRVMFTVRRDELYAIHEQDRKIDLLISTLLRSYSGMFIDYVAIDESLLAKTCQLAPQETYQMLMQLSRRRIIDYIPRKSIPHIEFTQNRIEKEDIYINKVIYDDRRSILSQHIDAMIDYATEDDTCRQRYLLNYFGEKHHHDCGQCDICIENESIRKEGGLIKQVLKFIKGETDEDPQKEEQKQKIHDEIVRQVSAAGKIHPFMLQLDSFDSALAKEVITDMSANREIVMDDTMRISLNA